MIQLGSEILDTSPLWAFSLLLTRFSAVLLVLPGIGSEQIPQPIRFFGAMMLAVVITLTGARAPEAAHIGEMIVMIGSELCLGFALGLIPVFVLGGLAVAGQVISGAIGLGQANMMDRSLGGSIAVLARIQILIATAVFLLVDGHHIVLRAAAGIPGELGLGLFRPNMDTAAILTERLISTFELSVVVAGPIIVTTLVTQFVLGLITKFVPQMNIFIISLPLSILVGLYIMEFTFPGLVNHTINEISQIEEILGQLYPRLAGIEAANQIPGT